MIWKGKFSWGEVWRGVDHQASRREALLVKVSSGTVRVIWRGLAK